MPTQAASPPLHRLLGQTADAVAAVRAGRSLTEVLAACPAELRGGTQALSFAVLRVLGGAQAVRALMAPKAPPPAVDTLLVTALALLWPGESPPPYAEHTLVDQAVTAARARTPAAAKFVNAVLRRFLRERTALVAEARRQPVAAHNHPLWWIERLRQDWPAQADALMAAANHHPPMVLRVNARRGTAADYGQRLAALGRGAARVDDPALGGQALVLDRPCAVHELPGFAEGDVSVQDLSAQRAAPLLLGGGQSGALPALAPGARVLDACAAPGGKTAHLLERADLDLLALDSDARRLTRVQDTLKRLQLPAATPGGGTVRLQAADARQVASWWDGRPFDAILLDAPCTASGIVRRHPDVRWLRRADDVAALAAVQRELLDALWPLLAPGGRLLYATCSIFMAEGQQQIVAFLQRHAAQQPQLAAASPGHLLGVPDNPHSPAEALTGDGFYYALIHKP
ncbi:MAG: 16S rRNA (cytosine(967)-C(5))-methyltransferase RsmB [Aquabacterium sp.]|nr:16S rRNA (cytosine(967)-C(5))-methyltransferase RsmB [Aquabacterium sp.]